MWELYDSLLDEIPSYLKVESAFVGNYWTVVTADNGNMGVAMTTNLTTLPPQSAGYVGQTLRDVGSLVRSWNLIEAGIGMAAINAWYNSSGRLEALGSRQKDDRYCTFDIPVEGKKIVKVGHIRHRHGVFDLADSVVTLERSPMNGEYPDSACEYMIPESDIVLITGSAFINKTMPRLLQLAAGKTVIITGPSTPMAPQLFRFGVSRLAGMIVANRDGMMDFTGTGFPGTPYLYGERFCLSNLK